MPFTNVIDNGANGSTGTLTTSDGVLVDLNDAIADSTVDFTQGGAATHEITAFGGISSTGSPTSGSFGFVHFQSPVSTMRISNTDAPFWKR